MAVGHGTAVDWDSDLGDPARATAVYTCMLPRFDLCLADSNPAIDTSALEMRHLMEVSRSKALEGLQNLCRDYEQWISRTSTQVADVDQMLQATAERHLDRCRDALRRMRTGIKLLANNTWVPQLIGFLVRDPG